MGAPHITKTHDVLADVGCMSLPGTDPVPALRAAQRCGATPILWATGQPIANQLDPLVVWADVPPDGPLPPNVTALIAATERAAAIDPERTDLVRIPAINSIGQLDKALSLLAQSSGPGHLVLVGNEAAGPVGDTSTFILLQQVTRALRRGEHQAPAIWVRGGIGPNTAAAAIAGGASGVILDTQTALLRESTVPPTVRRIIEAADGSETRVLSGHRVFVRPDLPTADRESLPDALNFGFNDPQTQVIPAGQDLPVARRLATIGVTVAGAVQAIRRAMYADVSAASTTATLRPGGPLAERTGATHPVLQGPMTRVSDTPAFTEAVARGGGLPFLALALLRGPEVERLLTETTDRLGELPWGVGILGFVPPELRAEQLEVVKAYRPPMAIIAGGRPSQAKELDDLGIRTYLHVPSPGLLQRFLADGARRFIFEGRECGGHVGPRSSFALWQAQLDVLADHANVAELDVIFAGGIHDDTSAAMVAAMAQPLAARGAAIGVLAGTAYLFTEEIVTSGAIVPGFQRAALECTATSLVETAPGHATRCVAGPFVEAFEARRGELMAADVPASERWAELEQMNLGRLRLASKGLERTAAGLTEVDEAGQREGGMFMIGEVATMGHEPLTVAALHDRLTTGSVGLLAHRTEELTEAGFLPADDEGRAPAPLDIAIIGMECVLPGAANVEEFWTNTVLGRNAVTEVPHSRWDADRFFDPSGDAANSGLLSPSKWGAFVPPVPFDPLAFGIPPASLAAIEPVQLLSLEVASRALANAGYEHRHFDRDRTSVIFGAEAGTDLSSSYGFRSIWPSLLGELPPELDDHLPRLTEDSFPGLLTNVISGRIANRLDLGGANYTVDAACASSLTALDAACKELTAGSSDMVLCGGADLHNGINDYLLFSSVHALSPTGQCRTFSSDADGITLGEGIACVVLKRLEDARRDGDTIHAVIKAVAASSDGRHLGLTAPRKDGQVRCLERAYAQSGIDPADVGLMEAHGTGTVVGDRTELATLTELFGGAGAEVGSTVLGSVKSQIGHTKCAAGLAGLIRVARAVSTGVRPPTNNITTPNDYWDPTTSPFRLDGSATPWLDEHRTAGVSGFGFGGTNFHAVIEAPDGEPTPAHGLTAWPAELFVFTGATLTAAKVMVDQLVGHLDHYGPAAEPLRNLAATVWARRSGPPQVSVIATDAADLRAKLTTVLATADTATETTGSTASTGSTAPTGGSDRPSLPRIHWANPMAEDAKVAFVYPGQGSQRPRMLSDLYVAFPHLREVFREGARWTDLLFPPTAFDSETRAAQLAAVTDTRVAQPTLGIAGITLTRLLDTLGVRPDLAAGHSYGELVALWAAGALPTDGFLDLSEARGEAILAATMMGGEPPAEGETNGASETNEPMDDAGAMAALALGADRAEEIIDSLTLSRAAVGDACVVVANRNAPNQSVVSGPTAAVRAVVDEATRLGERATLLNVACAFHSPMVAAAATTLGARLNEIDLAEPRFDVYSNVTARPYGDADDVARLLAAQVAEPVRFTDEIEAMYAAGTRVFVEAGPGRVLSRLVGLTLGDRPHQAINCDVAGESSLNNLLDALGRLAMTGLPVTLDALFDKRTITVDLSARGAVPGWSVDGHLVRGRDGSPVSGGLRPAHEFVEAHPMGLPNDNHPNGRPRGEAGLTDGFGADPALMQYLQGMREMVAAQRDVMMSYLGVAVAPGSPVIDTTLTAGSTSPSLATRHRSPEANSSNDQGVEHGRHQGEPAGDDAAPPVLGAAELEALVTSIVADRTGYPVDMLNPDLDLEADLSIDSIKRIEILGELAERAGLPGADEGSLDESVVEALAMIKTIRGIATWIVEHRDDPAEGNTEASGVPTDPTDERPGGTDVAGLGDDDQSITVPDEALSLLPVVVAASPDGEPVTVRDLTVWITDGVAATDLAAAVAAGGGTPVLFDGDAAVPDGDPDVLIDTTGLSNTPGLCNTPGLSNTVRSTDLTASGANRSYATLRQALLRGVRHVVLATGDGGRFGMDHHRSAEPGQSLPGPTGDASPPEGAGALRVGGYRGLARAAAREYPEVGVRCVDLDPTETPSALAAHLMAEIGGPDPDNSVMGRTADSRVAIRWQRVRPDAPTDADASGEGRPDLGPGRAALLTGGARGITAKVAVGLAGRFGCPIALVGRSPEPIGTPSAELADHPDDRELRRRLIEGGMTNPRDIESRLASLSAEAEIRATMASLTDLGVPVRYLQADVADPEAVEAAMATVAAELAPIGLVVHGAGVLADHLIRDKGPEEFQRVWHTKVTGALALHRAAPEDADLVFFASISGAVGNVGQVDYGAANDALDLLAHTLEDRNVLAIDWGPWAGGGMVSPELEREYERRGVGLVPVEAGVNLVCRHVAAGLPQRQVMFVRAEPAAIGAVEAEPVGASGDGGA